MLNSSKHAYQIYTPSPRPRTIHTASLPSPTQALRVEIYHAPSRHLPIAQLVHCVGQVLDWELLVDRLEEALFSSALRILSLLQRASERMVRMGRKRWKTYSRSKIQRRVRVPHRPHHRPDDAQILEDEPRGICACYGGAGWCCNIMMSLHNPASASSREGGRNSRRPTHITFPPVLTIIGALL